MMIRTLCFSVAAFLVLGLSFDSHAVSCNRNAEVHKSRAQNIMSKTHSGQVVTKDDEEFMLCMLQEKEDKQDFQTRVQNNRENERRRAAAEAERQRLAEIERNRPYRADECAGDNRPCGHACYTPTSGQACVNGQVICTPEGQQRLLCSPTRAQIANPGLVAKATFSKPTVTQGGLIWMPPTFLRKWAGANDYCQGMSGWRLPTQIEAQNLVRSGAINGQGWFSPGYGQAGWTSTSAEPRIHISVVFQSGDLQPLRDEYESSVTCVRVAAP